MVNQCRIFPAQITRVFFELPVIDLEALVPVMAAPEEPILADLCLPNHTSGAGHNDLIPLLRIVRSKQPHLVVELGTAHGNTTANICRQCPAALVYTVNALPEQITGGVITFALNRDEIGRVYRQHGYQNRVTPIFQNTLHLDLGTYLQRSSVDLAIIDACHDTPYVLNDFAKIEPYMRPGGMVLFHDTHPSMEEHLAGSYRACMKLRSQGYDIRHIRGTWWAVWQVPTADSGRKVDHEVK